MGDSGNININNTNKITHIVMHCDLYWWEKKRSEAETSASINERVI